MAPKLCRGHSGRLRVGEGWRPSHKSVLGSEATRHWAAVFTVTFDAPPATEASEEMADFRWWTLNTDLWEGLSPLDAEVARRCLPTDFAPPAIR